MPAPSDPLRDLYKSLTGRGALPLERDDPYYVPILQATPERDPILMLWQRLDWAESESVHLLTGFRGNGKSTELRRLKALLEQQSEARVFLVNMTDFLLLTKPLELSDFVLSLMTALGQAVERETSLNALTHSYWERLHAFLTAEVRIDLSDLDLAAVYRARVTGLEVPLPATAEGLLEGQLPRLLNPPTYVQALKGPVWLDLTRLPADDGTPSRARLAADVDNGEALRDLSVSLDNVGRIDQALGDLETARTAFGESLDIARRLAQALPNHKDFEGLVSRFEQRIATLASRSEGD
ncbi:hypothetical protein ABC977_03205 [Thioalkalicoccus limnaeus]|uniref:Orc1-like AAA ATPase domain-containing protein n=1 Tax=Thioalkalicoccus limnaeus TaxID=120681 RepID=A0ABV4BAF2_9GAMM